MPVALGVIFLGFSLGTNADTIEFPACVEGKVLNKKIQMHLPNDFFL